jgi:outer membrane protein TolC
MFNKYTKTSIFVFIFLLQACVSPLSIQNERNITVSSISQTGKNNTGSNHPNPNETITLPSTGASTVQTSLASRMEELEALSPSRDSDDWEIPLGLNLHHNQAHSAKLSMESAIILAIENNLDIQISSIQPQIAAQSTIAADAAFDTVFGAGLSKNRVRVPQQQIINQFGQPLSSAERATDIFSSNASITKKLQSGGTFLLSTNITKTESDSQEFNYEPDPAWQTIGTVELNQPLLRNFGKKVTRSQIQLSKIDQDKTGEELRNTLNEVITNTEQSYLNLCLQWRLLQINHWLLEQGEYVEKTLKLRLSYDASEADYAQAVATVQRRRAEVIKQQSEVQAASDTVKKLINSEKHRLESEQVIQPTESVQANPIVISLRQALMTAIENRPDIRSLALTIRSSEINIDVAENARLPQLDMQAQMSLYGLGNTVGDGYNEVFDTNYMNYLAGLSLSVPIGNRAADASAKITRLRQMSAIASYKKGIQQATIEIKKALRDIVTSAALIDANKDYRIAQTENLRALLVEEETMAGLTPTFLNLKLQTQSGLASARTAEISSVINYNKAIAELYKAMGTTLLRHQMSINNSNETE